MFATMAAPAPRIGLAGLATAAVGAATGATGAAGAARPVRGPRGCGRRRRGGRRRPARQARPWPLTAGSGSRRRTPARTRSPTTGRRGTARTSRRRATSSARSAPSGPRPLRSMLPATPSPPRAAAPTPRSSWCRAGRRCRVAPGPGGARWSGARDAGPPVGSRRPVRRWSPPVAFRDDATPSPTPPRPALALPLLLAACGGGDGGSSADLPADPDLTVTGDLGHQVRHARRTRRDRPGLDVVSSDDTSEPVARR